jgi:hypothetical protein
MLGSAPSAGLATADGLLEKLTVEWLDAFHPSWVQKVMSRVGAKRVCFRVTISFGSVVFEESLEYLGEAGG